MALVDVKKTCLNLVMSFVRKQLEGTSSLIGYRYMHLKARAAGLVVDRETIRLVMKVMDAEVVSLRATHKLKRRKYIYNGSNETWHMDGYDKLKPFSFAIHGCIDGFSRKIIWLRVASSNNDPKVIASYFIDSLSKLKLGQKIIRADRGTENIYVAGIQRYVRRNDEEPPGNGSCFLFGSSTSNQRIESWWSQFRCSYSTWWINYFKDLIEQNIFDSSKTYHVECIRFCYMGLLQRELEEVSSMWNNHRTRAVRNSECPAGRPAVIYDAPELFGGYESGRTVAINDLNLNPLYSGFQPIFLILLL